MQTGTTNNMKETTMHTLINLEYLELMADGDQDMKVTMLDMLLTEMPEELEKMGNELAAQDWESLGSTSHKMKSTLSFVGNPQMTEANKSIETICKSGTDLGQLAGQLATLKEMAPKVLEAIRQEVARLSV